MSPFVRMSLIKSASAFRFISGNRPENRMKGIAELFDIGAARLTSALTMQSNDAPQ